MGLEYIATFLLVSLRAINDMLILACVPVVYKNITSYFINIQYNLKLEFSYIMKRILWFLFFISVLSSLLFQSTFS